MHTEEGILFHFFSSMTRDNLFISSLFIIPVSSVEFKITLILLCAVIFIILLYKKITKPFFFNLGKIRLESSGLLNKILIQTFNLVKEIKILNKQNYFSEEYKKILRNYLDSSRKSSVQVSITRQVFEIVALLVLLVMVFFFLNNLTKFSDPLTDSFFSIIF